MATYLTGDTHGGRDKGGIPRWHGTVRDTLTRSDHLIIAGDCGAFWAEDSTADFRAWLQELGCTVLFIDGNHEDHQRLAALPSAGMFGADVGVGGDHLFHLRRGRVYTIGGKTWFCYGGGLSIDKALRTPFMNWWPEEIPSREEFERGVDALIAVDWKVDYVLTHTAPSDVLRDLEWVHPDKKQDSTVFQLNRFRDLVSCRKLFCGHFHKDVEVGDVRMLFSEVVGVG
jgi:hypothetical protein